MTQTSIKISQTIIIMLVFLNVIISCSIFEYRQFPRSKSEYITFSFQYPREWTLVPINVGRGNAIETWQLKIPEKDSNIKIFIWPQSSNEEAKKLLSEEYLLFYQDIPGIKREEIDICEKKFDLLTYYQPEQLYDDFIINEADILNFSFVHQNVYYIFEAEILRNERASYDEIQDEFLAIIKSIHCGQ